jgi:hypothetical protein
MNDSATAFHQSGAPTRADSAASARSRSSPRPSVSQPTSDTSQSARPSRYTCNDGPPAHAPTTHSPRPAHLNDDSFVNKRRRLSLSMHVADEPFVPTRLPGSTKPKCITARPLTTSLGGPHGQAKRATHARFITTATTQDVERLDGHHQPAHPSFATIRRPPPDAAIVRHIRLVANSDALADHPQTQDARPIARDKLAEAVRASRPSVVGRGGVTFGRP